VLVRSTNLGVSFGPEILVNDDAANLDNCIPALTVDPLGKVSVFYYDCRDAGGTRALRSYYRNVSFDGANTWQPGQRISDELMYFNLNTVAIPNYGEYNQACAARGFAPGTSVVYGSWSDERLSNASTPAGSGVDCYIAKMQSCVTVLCAPDQTAASGDTIALNLCVENCGNFADDVDYTIADSQGWVTPASSSVNVAASDSTCIPVTCNVPGATPDGTQTVITLIATARSCPAASDTCRTTITVQSTTDAQLDAGTGSFFGFRGAAPNPFNGRTSFTFRLDRERLVRMRIYDVRGQLVRVVQDGRLDAGLQVLEWDGKDPSGHTVGAGGYFYRLEIDQRSVTRKVVRMP
jgi:hypothetical protein